MSFYPKLDADALKALKVVRQLMTEQPDYLTSMECPYGGETVAFLSSLGAGGGGGGVREGGRGDDGVAIDIEAETLLTFKDLTSHKPDMNDAAAVQSYYRTRTTLLQKLHELREKTQNSKSVGEFYTEVLNILDEVCDAEQKAQFRARLQAFAGE